MTGSLVRELRSLDQRVEGPGVYLLADDIHTYGLKPLCTEDGRECVPFEWATEFPPVGEFIQRFDRHWLAVAHTEAWIGGPYNPVGIYWVRFDRRALGAGP